MGGREGRGEEGGRVEGIDGGREGGREGEGRGGSGGAEGGREGGGEGREGRGREGGRDDQNWRSIVISVLVIVAVCGLIALSIILVMPCKCYNKIRYNSNLLSRKEEICVQR